MPYTSSSIVVRTMYSASFGSWQAQEPCPLREFCGKKWSDGQEQKIGEDENNQIQYEAELEFSMIGYWGGETQDANQRTKVRCEEHRMLHIQYKVTKKIPRGKDAKFQREDKTDTLGYSDSDPGM